MHFWVSAARVSSRDGAGPFADVGFFLAEENGDELVHAGVREEQVRRIRHEAGRRHDGVLLRLEEIEERLANLC